MQVIFETVLIELEKKDKLFMKLFEKKSIEVELYRPKGSDSQQPHEKDEIYIIAAGTGVFLLESVKYEFKINDFFFVERGQSHRFIEFTKDFAAWVIFF